MRARNELQQKSALAEQLKAQVEEIKLQMSQNGTQLIDLQTEKVNILKLRHQWTMEL